jgi:membrane fusion protein (multidrug efflux system)
MISSRVLVPLLVLATGSAHADSRAWSVGKAVIPGGAQIVGGVNAASLRASKLYETLMPMVWMQASDAKAQLDLTHTTVTAPSDGVISQTDRLQLGEYVDTGSTVMSLVETSRSWIEANFKETELTNLAHGQPAEVTIDSYPGQRFRGTVESVGAGTGAEFSLLPAQNATGNWVKVVQRIPVRIALSPEGDMPALRAGMSAHVSVDTGQSTPFDVGLRSMTPGASAQAQPGSSAPAD